MPLPSFPWPEDLSSGRPWVIAGASPTRIFPVETGPKGPRPAEHFARSRAASRSDGPGPRAFDCQNEADAPPAPTNNPSSPRQDARVRLSSEHWATISAPGPGSEAPARMADSLSRGGACEPRERRGDVVARIRATKKTAPPGQLHKMPAANRGPVICRR